MGYIHKGKVFFSLVHTKKLTIESLKIEVDVKTRS